MDTIKMKKCCRCHKELPATNEFFSKFGSSKDGLRYCCKDCNNVQNRKYNKTPKEQRDAYDKEYNWEKVLDVTCALYRKYYLELKKEMSDHVQASTEKIEELRKVDEEYKVDFAKIDNDINKLTNMFIEKQISDMRFNIVDVASGITMGMRYSIEQLSHVMHIHDDYEKILAERNMKNGQVDMSMEIIESEYRRLTQAQIHETEGHNG